MDVNDTFAPAYPLIHWVPTASERRKTRAKSTCLGKLCNSLKMCGLSKDARPWLSYVSLITVALLSNPRKMLKINEIYDFIEQTFPYYRYSRVNWRNSVRHNLSLNDCFVKVTVGTEKGKRRGHYWTLHPDSFTMFDQGSLMRRHRRFVKPSNEREDTSKANAENALVMPILQKISEELTRWRQQILALQPEVCKPSIVDYRQNLFDSNIQVGYFQGNQAAEQASFTHYQCGLQSSQIEEFNPPGTTILKSKLKFVICFEPACNIMVWTTQRQNLF
ncbi:Fork head domain containing protein [Trichuris trichiura]|uniref:Fork head domain containing protein n=1 Tax=Trichuris trichiura TaxID=36087 RepID=A0A077Z3V0_TRITR|nr:Fork head domain containing protein [Trichuris trichiura]